MRKVTFALLSLVVAIVLIGCSKTETSNNSNTAAPSANTGSTSTTSTTTTSTSTAETASTSSDKIGVPECDDFIAKYDACVSGKVPEMVRAQYKEAIARTRNEMRTRANDPATKSTMASYCKQALEQAKTSLTPFNCAW